MSTKTYNYDHHNPVPATPHQACRSGNLEWDTPSVYIEGGTPGDGQGIVVMSPGEALDWLENNGKDVPNGCPEIEALVEEG